MQELENDEGSLPPKSTQVGAGLPGQAIALYEITSTAGPVCAAAAAQKTIPAKRTAKTGVTHTRRGVKFTCPHTAAKRIVPCCHKYTAGLGSGCVAQSRFYARQLPNSLRRPLPRPAECRPRLIPALRNTLGERPRGRATEAQTSPRSQNEHPQLTAGGTRAVSFDFRQQQPASVASLA